jgi:hypothetical protein
MDTVLIVALPGIVGGLLIAWIAIRLGPARRANDLREAADGLPETDVRRDFLAHDLINMSRVPVAGIGGLGLVAMSLFVAWMLPRVWQTVVFGALAGAVFAFALIAYRRRTGVMSSSGRTPGAHTTLSIDNPPTPSEAPAPQDTPPRRRLRGIVVRAPGSLPS